MKWLLLRCPYNTTHHRIDPGTEYDEPVLVPNSLWYSSGKVYKVVGIRGGDMVTYALEPLDSDSMDQTMCNMINDLPLEALPKYLSFGGDRYYFHYLVIRRIRG
jgi:hypothetical protein